MPGASLLATGIPDMHRVAHSLAGLAPLGRVCPGVRTA